MNYYQQKIKEITHCSDSDSVEIEDYMRHIIFHSTLDWQTEAQFKKGAKTAYGDILYMRSPEGLAYMKSLELQYK
jgi:hypothetical protein